MIAPRLLTLLLFPIVGAGAARAFRLPLPGSTPERLSLWYLLGLGTNGVILFALGTAQIPLTPIVVAAPCFAALAVLAFMRNPVPAAIHRYPAAATLLLLAPAAVTLLLTTILPLADYDGRVTWFPKACAIVHEQSITGPFFQGKHGLNLHNQYPLLLPVNAAAILELSGTVDAEAIRWLYALVPVAALLVARGIVSRLTAPTAVAWIFAALAWLPAIAVRLEGGAGSAYSDLTVAAFFGLATLSIMEGEVAVAGAWLAFLVLTKNEGVPLAVALVTPAVLLRMVPTPRAAGSLVIPPLVTATLLSAWRGMVPSAYDERYGVLVRELPRRLDRLDDAARALVTRAMAVESWGFFWLAVAAGSVCILLRARRRAPLLSVAVIALGLAGYTAVLAVTSWDIEELARVTADRLLVHFVIPAGAVLVMGWDALAKRERAEVP